MLSITPGGTFSIGEVPTKLYGQTVDRTRSRAEPFDGTSLPPPLLGALPPELDELPPAMINTAIRPTHNRAAITTPTQPAIPQPPRTFIPLPSSAAGMAAIGTPGGIPGGTPPGGAP